MPDPLPPRPGVLLGVMLLSMSSGLLDAVVYMRHGQVFANAMTGNLVLLGVALLSHSSVAVLQHLVPLAGFVLGTFLGKSLLRLHRSASLHTALLLQMAVLAIAGTCSSQLSFATLVSSLAISGAVIVTVIRRIGPIALNVTFMTGNLRSVCEGAFDTLFPPPQTLQASSGPDQFAVVGLMCAGFLFGAGSGALAATRFGDHSFFLSDGLLLIAGVLLWSVRESSN